MGFGDWFLKMVENYSFLNWLNLILSGNPIWVGTRNARGFQIIFRLYTFVTCTAAEESQPALYNSTHKKTPYTDRSLHIPSTTSTSAATTETTNNIQRRRKGASKTQAKPTDMSPAEQNEERMAKGDGYIFTRPTLILDKDHWLSIVPAQQNTLETMPRRQLGRSLSTDRRNKKHRRKKSKWPSNRNRCPLTTTPISRFEPGSRAAKYQQWRWTSIQKYRARGNAKPCSSLRQRGPSLQGWQNPPLEDRF